jgi:hypothetical protein
MRDPNRFVPHARFPEAKKIRLSGNVITGQYDFSKPFDPFDSYRKASRKSPHLELANVKPGPEGVFGFVQAWGPLRFDEWNSQDVLIDEYIHRLSHPNTKILAMRLYRPPNPNFTINIEEFLNEQRKVSSLLQLWQAFREEDDEKVRSKLEGWHFDMFYTPRVGDPFETDASAIRKVVSTGSTKELRMIAAECLHIACFDTFGIRNPLTPCLALVEKDGVASGFQFEYHVRNLIDAIYFMLYLDMSKGQAVMSCANCGDSFLATKMNQKCCRPHCTGALNARKSYQRRKEKQQHVAKRSRQGGRNR